MGKLNAYQRQQVGENTTSARKAGSEKIVTVVTPHTSNGEIVAGILKNVYPDYNVVSTDSFFSDISLGGLLGDWTRFRVNCRNKQKATELMQEINSCIEEYNNPAATNTSTNENPTNTTSTTSTNEVVQTTASKAKSWTTYIIIGAALAVIALLLWNRKK